MKMSEERRRRRTNRPKGDKNVRSGGITHTRTPRTDMYMYVCRYYRGWKVFFSSDVCEHGINVAFSLLCACVCVYNTRICLFVKLLTSIRPKRSLKNQ